MMKVMCIDAANQFEDVGFSVAEGQVYHVLEAQEFDGKMFYLIYRKGFFKYYFDAERFMVVGYEVETVSIQQSLTLK